MINSDIHITIISIKETTYTPLLLKEPLFTPNNNEGKHMFLTSWLFDEYPITIVKKVPIILMNTATCGWINNSKKSVINTNTYSTRKYIINDLIMLSLGVAL